MVDGSTAILAPVRTVVLVLGLSIAALSYRAYRRTGSRYLRNASIGFAIVAFGVFFEGVLFELLALELVTVHTINSIVIAVGFGVLLSSPCSLTVGRTILDRNGN